MEHSCEIQVPRVKLGSQGGSLSSILNAPLPHEAGGQILKQAFNRGITFFDTADIYGKQGHNEIMIGKALKDLPRDRVQIATKFGLLVLPPCCLSAQTFHPRFTGDNQEKNRAIYTRFAGLAAKHSCTPPQLALAWLLHQGDDVVPIPGTTKIENLEANAASLRVKLTAEELEEIGEAIPVDQVGGDRDLGIFTKFAYKLASTPPYEK
ncbi:perakine reductase-like [Salvia splendens]|uniref:perakine reductase-like n=1 Tax=Salvia splendens TaxID=180675 RepID=UPI0011011081|nr:perakine reductase-like [Salvia splendens]